MSRRVRVRVFMVLTALICLATTSYLVQLVRTRAEGPARVDAATAGPGLRHDVRLLFRGTRPDAGFGLVSRAGPVAPGLRRDLGRRCDRLDAVSAGTFACLTAVSSVLARTRVAVTRPDGERTSWTVTGVPSRTRLSPDGKRVATTVFVAGHSYTSAAFATATEIGDVTGRHRVNLERYSLEIEGRRVRPVDRNLWGVTFADDGDTFYVTVATGGRTWLARGSVRRRLVRTVHERAECPSLSPDQTRVAFKVRDARPGATWSLAVLDLRTGRETLLGERHTVDDQVEWLDDDTVLYGRPHEGRPGTSDVWALSATAGGRPRLALADAASPAVLRR